MILEVTKKVKYAEYICKGRLELYEKNEALKNILRSIDGGKQLIPDRFVVSMRASLEADGYIDGDAVTPLGREVIESGCAWSAYEGTHLLRVVELGSSRYVVDHKCDYQGSFNGDSQSSPSLVGDFECGGMRMRNISLEPKVLKTVERDVELTCVYDFSEGRSTYSLEANNNHYSFKGNRESFDILDKDTAEKQLAGELRLYKDLEYKDGRIILTRLDGNNPLVRGVLDEIFDKDRGSFTHKSGTATVSDARLCIRDDAVAEGALLMYLEGNAEKRYCGRDEINRLVSVFYTLFDGCPDVIRGTTELIEELRTKCAKANVTAYLHLMACEDLQPSGRALGYERSINDLSQKRKTMKDVVTAIVGERERVISVSTATKYARSNAAISRGLCLFADALRAKYDGARLYLYTADDQRERASSKMQQTNLHFYSMLDENGSITHKKIPADSFKGVHDRYYLIRTETDSYWVKTTNEINALRYPDDYEGGVPREDIEISTRGVMQDFTVIALDDSGIRNEVKALLEAEK